MARRAYCTPSAAPATSFVLERTSIRWRLALTSAGLTFLILSAFAIGVYQVTTARIRSDFNNEIAASVDKLRDGLELTLDSQHNPAVIVRTPLDVVASKNAIIRILSPSDGAIFAETENAPNLGRPAQVPSTETTQGYRVEARLAQVRPSGVRRVSIPVVIQYARPVKDLEATIDRVRFFLILGVLMGGGLALIAGLIIARRAMSPIAALTGAAREIEQTRDPSRRVPVPETDDEVGELARTLEAMLDALEDAREETQEALTRQRQFVADASHELRTPLTSILANLELLADVLDGERGEAARSALRSSQRMRRLVGDLLLLARADANRHQPREPLDLGRVAIEAAAELGPVADGHELIVEAGEAVVDGARDELHRMTLNLMENAVRHTPPDTCVRVRVENGDGAVRLTVQDDGPGVPPELRERIFERFVRGEGDRGSSSGLGLAIVRAVVEGHGGSVELEDARPGARFVVLLPPSPAPLPEPKRMPAPAL
jgi:two-component system, OmpR family, sensor kinase